MDVPNNFLSRVGLAISMYASSKGSDGGGGGGEREGCTVVEDEHAFSSIRNSELYPHNSKVVDKDCSPTAQPFPSLSGEALEYIGLLAPNCYIAISNYRFFVSREDGFYNVPLGLIDAVELFGSKEQLVVLCKDGGRFCVAFDSQSSCHMWQERLRKVTHGTRELNKTFAFVHWAYMKDQLASKEVPSHNGGTLTQLKSGQDSNSCITGHFRAQPYSSDVVRTEFYRMRMHTGRAWRITDCNCEYKLCATYPKLLVVPSSLSEEEIRSAARFRALGRVPTVVWRHSLNGAVIVRSSQPLVGVLSWRNSEDEKLLLAISHSCALTSPKRHMSSTPVPIPYQNGGPPVQLMDDRGQSVLIANGVANGHSLHESSEQSHSQEALQSPSMSCPEFQDRHEACPDLLVMDLRSYTAALGNRAKGGGCECTDYYPNCEIVYKNLPNIHSVRKSFQQLRNLLLYDDPSNFLSNLESTQWLGYLCQLVSVACDVVKTVDEGGRPVLVHCSDGWDRTAQVVPLAELMLDPYYRTIEGFQVLIEREWVGFGHRFSDRCGQHSACSDTNQRSPVFLQWLDCVHQLVLQFPCHFQFNLNFLVKLGLHSYSCLYGTLLGNSMKERDGVRVGEHTLSLWSLLNVHNSDVVNPLYTSRGPRVLHPVARIHKMQLWHAMLTAPSLTPSSALTSTNTTIHRDTTIEDKVSRGMEGESPQSALPVEVEMREMSFGRRRTTSDHVHSDSSFASVSSSSPSPPQPPGENGGELKTRPPGIEGDQQREPGEGAVSEREEGERDEIAMTRLSEGMSALSSKLQSSPNLSSTTSDVTTIATGSPHSNHVSPTTNALTLPDLSTSPHIAGLSSDLLHDAIHDHSPRQQQLVLHLPPSQLNGSGTHVGEMAGGANGGGGAESESAGEWSCSVGLDVDGLSSRRSEADQRLMCILHSYEERIAGLKRELVRVKAALAACVREDGVKPGGREDGGKEGEEEEEAATVGATIAEDNQSPSSLASWDCVEGGEGEVVKWVPDHAATHCQGCAAAFSLVIRKHHCRACGGIFCYSCTDYMCPVPDEHLYTKVRVCSRCYYRLDGHLVVESSGST